MQDSHSLAVTLHEASEVVSKTEEGTQLGDGSWCGPFGHDFNFRRINLDTLGANNMTQEVDFRLVEITFLKLGVELMFTEALEYKIKMLGMIGGGLGIIRISSKYTTTKSLM
ncbi:hypothetical protein [Bosea sp. (in: a-proteobacteria)]|uniref:hypothetical protein n=1 Tax=Bosea sp. (in: a-proteobacteria) TaxID=1871050 RepID=UPI00403442C9